LDPSLFKSDLPSRLLDILVALLGCLVLLLMLPFLALLIKLDSRGPVFFACRRVGQGGKVFKMYKFRTMYETAGPIGASVSPWGDPRVSPMGALLRRLKLNEFPQFFNILKGDMTLIGPRPEAPDLAAAYPPEARQIFSVKPGLLGPNQIQGRNEEEFYPYGEDPKTYYLKHILPQKLPLDQEYIQKKSIGWDLRLLFKGIWVTITGAVTRRHLFDNLSQLLMIGLDVVCCLLSLTLAHVLRFDNFSDPAMTPLLLKLLPWAVLVRLPFFLYFHFYHTLVRHFSYFEIRQIFWGVTASSLAFTFITLFFGLAPGYSRAVFLIDWFSLTFLLIFYRALLRTLRQNVVKNGNGHPKRRALICGAGDYGELCLSYLNKKENPCYEVVGFIDDDLNKRNKRLNGVKVLGDRHHIEVLCQLYKVQEIFVTMHPIPREKVQHLFEKTQHLGVSLKLFTADSVEF
jgi:lipopolysaccharide/colanic/teichoic acid biosynthesis glycosyltransferase